jgi:hypothetical protein
MIANSPTNRRRCFLVELCVALLLSTSLSMASDLSVSAQSPQDKGAAEATQAKSSALWEQVRKLGSGQRIGAYLPNERTVEGGAFMRPSLNDLSPRSKAGSFMGSSPGEAERKADKTNWDNLKQLAPGDDIRVVLNNGTACRGKLEIVSDAEILVRTEMGNQTFTRQSMHQVSAKRVSHRKRNAFIGLAVGAGAGVISVFASSKLTSSTCGGRPGYCVDAAMVTTGAFWGGAVGTGIGALFPTGGWREIYRAR